MERKVRYEIEDGSREPDHKNFDMFIPHSADEALYLTYGDIAFAVANYEFKYSHPDKGSSSGKTDKFYLDEIRVSLNVKDPEKADRFRPEEWKPFIHNDVEYLYSYPTRPNKSRDFKRVGLYFTLGGYYEASMDFYAEKGTPFNDDVLRSIIDSVTFEKYTIPTSIE